MTGISNICCLNDGMNRSVRPFSVVGIQRRMRRMIFGGLLAAFAVAWPASLIAQSGALIVAGMSPSPEDAAVFQALADKTRQVLITRGLPAAHVEVLSENVTRQLVLDKLHAVTASTNDEFWLVLYGVSGKSRGGQPALQVGGPRFTADDLKTALDSIPARQFVFIGTGNAGGFLPVLQDRRRTVLSATQADGEPDQPRYPDLWLEVFGEDPRAPFNRIAAEAAARVDATYASSHLAQSEHSLLADPATGQILGPPFGVDLTVTNTPAH